MNPRIRAIANLIRAKKEQNARKCVLLLGAGASLSSGVKPTKEIMEGLLALYGPDLVDGTLRERFDRLWARSDASTRDMFLRPYLELRPSPGYSRLADLIGDGYFDLVITFNFDQLLETAMRASAVKDDFQVIVRGEYHNDDAVCQALELLRPRVKILKLHGGLSGGDTFLFTSREMHAYPERINNLLLDLTRQDIVVCGYAFQDECVTRAFSKEGGSIYCVNPGGVPPNISMCVANRNSKDWVIDGEGGRFDNFFTELHQALRLTLVPLPRPRANPFKFLVSYDTRDKDWFHGRRKLIQDVVRRFEEAPPKVMHLVGPPNIGKTSFVRAGMIANLNPDRFWPIYLRCRGPLDPWLPDQLRRLAPPAEGTEDGPTLVHRFAASTSKHVIVVLDQFERVVNRYSDRDSGPRQLRNCLDGLCNCACDNLSFVCVGVDDRNYWRALATVKHDLVEVRPLDRRVVGGIVSRLAHRAGIEFEPEVIRAIMQRYEDTRSSSGPFTLGHIQAVCNLLACSSHVDVAAYEAVMKDNADALDVALNVCDIVSFVEDIPDESGRNLFRKVMKVIPVESKKVLANYLKDNFSDLFAPPETAETAEQEKAAANA